MCWNWKRKNHKLYAGLCNVGVRIWIAERISTFEHCLRFDQLHFSVEVPFQCKVLSNRYIVEMFVYIFPSYIVIVIAWARVQLNYKKTFPKKIKFNSQFFIDSIHSEYIWNAFCLAIIFFSLNIGISFHISSAIKI